LTRASPCEDCSAFTRVAARTLAPSPICDLLHRRLQPFCYLHDCSGCFRLERLPGAACANWKGRLGTAHTLGRRCTLRIATVEATGRESCQMKLARGGPRPQPMGDTSAAFTARFSNRGCLVPPISSGGLRQFRRRSSRSNPWPFQRSHHTRLCRCKRSLKIRRPRCGRGYS